MSDYSPTHAGAPSPNDAPLTGQVVGTDLPPLRPGWQTTEFWITVVTTALSLAVALGWIGPNFVHDHAAEVNAIALLAATVAPAAYSIARGITKGKHQAAAAHLAAAQVPYPAVPLLP